ncbi:MAG: hypothetical protein WCC64_11100 [Aliidongia sp.]
MPNVEQIEKSGDISGLVNAAIQMGNTIGMVFSGQKTLVTVKHSDLSWAKIMPVYSFVNYLYRPFVPLSKELRRTAVCSAYRNHCFRGISIIFFLSTLVYSLGSAAEESEKNVKLEFSKLTEINIHSGLNDVELIATPGEGPFDPDIKIFNSNGNAPFRHMGKIMEIIDEYLGTRDTVLKYMILTSGLSYSPSDWVAIPRDPFSDDDLGGDIFSDEPNSRANDESRIKSIRFFNGDFKGNIATLIFIAKREYSREVDDHPGMTDISVFQLQTNDDRPPGIFKRIVDTRTKKAYCNADAALLAELRVPLPKTYTGTNNVDGCVDGKLFHN